jgi:transposase-like protein
MGLAGISKSTVSKLCKDIDDRVNAFLDRPLVGDWPYLWLDATYLKQREGGRITSVAAIFAVAVNTDGKREIVGLHIGPSEADGVGGPRHSGRRSSRAWFGAAYAAPSW